jgi:hypothetical protein
MTGEFTCKGCYALLSACGWCAKCDKERMQMRWEGQPPTHEEALAYFRTRSSDRASDKSVERHGGSMKLLKLLAPLLIMLGVAVTEYAQPNTWHTLGRLTAPERKSASYKFLVGKFGANRLMAECDTEGAALMGEGYLFQVASDTDSADGELYGTALGHGATLQQALDSAAASYIDPATTRRLHREMAQEQAEREARERAYRKKCCP